jgi:hypothetical protein
MADVPAGVGAPTQYGPGLRGLATYLLAGQYLPLARTAELLTELVGAPISEGSLSRWYADAAGSLGRFEEVLRAGLAGAGVLGADETGIRVAGALVQQVAHGVVLKYNKFYIGLAKGGVADNFMQFRPKKDFMVTEFRIPRSDEVTAMLDDSGIDRMEYEKKWGRYRVRLTKG